jgi:hypothetical protein
LKNLLALLLVFMLILIMASSCSKTDPTSSTTTASTTTSTSSTTTTSSTPAKPPTTSTSSTPAPVVFEVKGTAQTLSEVVNAQGMEEGILTRDTTTTHAYHGDLEGQLVFSGKMKIDTTDGKVSATSNGTFTGTVNGKSGSFTASFVTSGQMIPGELGTFSGEMTILNGTGALSGLHGVIMSNFLVDAVEVTNTRGNYSGILGIGTVPTQKPALPPLPTPTTTKPSTTTPPTVTSTTPAPATNTSGTIKRTNQVDNTPPVTKDGVWTGDRTSTSNIHGDLEGTWEQTGITTIVTATGKMNSKATATFTGKFKGKQGTFTAELTGTGQMYSATAGTTTLTVTITSGTGELAGLTGTIVITNSFDENSSTGTYKGTLDFGK